MCQEVKYFFKGRYERYLQMTAIATNIISVWYLFSKKAVLVTSSAYFETRWRCVKLYQYVFIYLFGVVCISILPLAV